jgi:hypothetical protein
MRNVQNIRAELAHRQPEKGTGRATILTVLGAFAVGGLLVLGWQFVPAATTSTPVRSISTARDAEVKIPASGDRLGRASRAPLLRACMTSRLMNAGQVSYSRRLGPRPRGVRNEPDWSFPGDPVHAYGILEAANTAARAASLFREAVGDDAMVLLASIWGLMAECIFNRDAVELCDGNNRALAADALSSHVRHAANVLAQPNISANLQLSHLAALKERVLIGFRSHLRDGALIAADFGMFAPEEVKRIARETKPARNVCAGAGRGR